MEVPDAWPSRSEAPRSKCSSKARFNEVSGSKRTEAFVSDDMHAELMTTRRRSTKAKINKTSKFESNSLIDREPVKCSK